MNFAVIAASITNVERMLRLFLAKNGVVVRADTMAKAADFVPDHDSGLVSKQPAVKLQSWSEMSGILGG